jgi:hypothetical protein
MSLAMAHPWKHPDTGYYWVRKRVPDHLRAIVGKREERFSLRTREPSEAKRLHAQKLAEIEERWSNLRRGQRPLTPDEIMRDAGAIGDQVRQQLNIDPYQASTWDIEIGASLWNAIDGSAVYTDISQPLSSRERKKLDQQNIWFAFVDERLVTRGLSTESDDRQRLARAVSIEMQRVAQEHQSYLLGQTEIRSLGSGSLKPALRTPSSPLKFQTVIEGWLIERPNVSEAPYSL